MHMTKNVLESLFGTILNMPEKTKDGPKARNVLRIMGLRKELHGKPKKSSEETKGKGKKVMQDNDKGKEDKKVYYCPPSCFTLRQKESDQFFKCLYGIKVSSDYTGKVSRYLDEINKVSTG